MKTFDTYFQHNTDNLIQTSYSGHNVSAFVINLYNTDTFVSVHTTVIRNNIFRIDGLMLEGHNHC